MSNIIAREFEVVGNTRLEFDGFYWTVIKSPIFIFGLIGMYLYFVLKLGPKMMKSKEPFRLRNILLIHNMIAVLLNAQIVSVGIIEIYKLHFEPKNFFVLMCESVVPENKVKLYTQLYGLFFISKIFELLDTVFFVLRKKQKQVTLLHVYHHTLMVFTCWLFIFFIPGEISLLLGLINCFVHVIMYTYYLIAALGPEYQKYIWWKKYLTRMQLGQFGLMLMALAGFWLIGCVLHQMFVYYATVNICINLYLFLSFYRNTYTTKANKPYENGRNGVGTAATRPVVR